MTRLWHFFKNLWTACLPGQLINRWVSAVRLCVELLFGLGMNDDAQRNGREPFSVVLLQAPFASWKGARYIGFYQFFVMKSCSSWRHVRSSRANVKSPSFFIW